MGTKLTASQKHRQTKREAARAALLLERSARVRAPADDLAWAAGMFEGEGTVTITKAGGSSGFYRYGNTRALVSLTSTDPEIVAFFHARWPGVLRSFTPRGNAKQATTWTLNVGEAIWRFLDDLEPHLRTGAERLKFSIVKADVESRIQGSRDPKYRQERHERRMLIRSLNRRGRE